jgi:hypothetical protein
MLVCPDRTLLSSSVNTSLCILGGTIPLATTLRSSCPHSKVIPSPRRTLTPGVPLPRRHLTQPHGIRKDVIDRHHVRHEAVSAFRAKCPEPDLRQGFFWHCAHVLCSVLESDGRSAKIHSSDVQERKTKAFSAQTLTCFWFDTSPGPTTREHEGCEPAPGNYLLTTGWSWVCGDRRHCVSRVKFGLRNKVSHKIARKGEKIAHQE